MISNKDKQDADIIIIEINRILKLLDRSPYVFTDEVQCIYDLINILNALKVELNEKSKDNCHNDDVSNEQPKKSSRCEDLVLSGDKCKQYIKNYNNVIIKNKIIT